VHHKPSILDLAAYAFGAWLIFVFGSALWRNYENIPREIASIPHAVAHFVGETLYEIIFIYIPGAALLTPILLIPYAEERLSYRWSRGWHEPRSSYARRLVLYRVVAWPLYGGALVLTGLYGNGLLG
jgi:hypothetical protein